MMMISISLSCGRMRIEEVEAYSHAQTLGTGANSSGGLTYSCPVDDEQYQPLLWEDEKSGAYIPTPKLWEQEHNALFV